MSLSKTESNLISAYAGECQAHMRYHIFADRAEGEGYPNTARLFKAIAYAEQVHAINHFSRIKHKGSIKTSSIAMFGSVTTEEALQHAIQGEHYETNIMYPDFAGVARDSGKHEAETSFRNALAAELIHEAFFSRTLNYVRNGKDLEIGDLCICSVCGYTVEGEPPEYCPICNVKKESYRTFS